MKRIAERFLDLLFPDDVACKACDRESVVDEYGLCKTCRKELKGIEHGCIKCGKALEQAGRCKDCGKVVHFFDRCVSVCQYTSVAASLVKGLKFSNKRHIAPKIALMMAKRWEELSLDADLVLPVPMYSKDKRNRGYNQSALIAKKFAELAGMEYRDALAKVKQTPQQVGLDRQERLANLKDVFEVREKADIEGKKVLVIDDVYTTGATLDACAEALKKGGAASVYGFTFLSGKMK